MRANMGVRIRFYKVAWYVFVSHRRRRRAKRIGDRDTALAVAKQIRERLACGDLGLLAEPTVTFQAYADRWLATVSGNRKASTHAFYEFNLRLHAYPTLGGRPIASISRADCRNLLAELRAKGLKRASLQGVQRTLSAVLSQAVEDELLQVNPAFRMGKHLGTGDEQPTEIQPFSRQEAHAFLETVKGGWPEYQAFFLVALRCGLRLGELLALKWEDVQLPARSLDVRRNRTRGKITSTKNRQRRSVDTYAHWLPNSDRSAVDRLDAAPAVATDCNPGATQADPKAVSGDGK